MTLKKLGIAIAVLCIAQTVWLVHLNSKYSRYETARAAAWRRYDDAVKQIEPVTHTQGSNNQQELVEERNYWYEREKIYRAAEDRARDDRFVTPYDWFRLWNRDYLK